ncbi:MAG TPA: NADPH-dependent F420 reductase [Vicinamibacteria bacterium]|nr:NADPH-dependent F420 reductase [Vicinamibacteria bacterium]
MKIAFLGYGNVGAPLADPPQRLGHEVTLAAADPGSETVRKARARNGALGVAAPRDALAGAGVVFLATPFQANQEVLAPLAARLAGKVLVDCTNPVGPGLRDGLESRESGSQAVQRLVPEARVVKAFSIYSFENFEDSAYPGYGVKPMMMLCGDAPAAKKTVGELITQLGWDPLDVGGLDQALHLEHMTLLWVRMVRAGGASPHLVWARLKELDGGGCRRQPGPARARMTGVARAVLRAPAGAVRDVHPGTLSNSVQNMEPNGRGRVAPLVIGRAL